MDLCRLSMGEKIEPVPNNEWRRLFRYDSVFSAEVGGGRNASQFGRISDGCMMLQSDSDRTQRESGPRRSETFSLTASVLSPLER